MILVGWPNLGLVSAMVRQALRSVDRLLEGRLVAFLGVQPLVEVVLRDGLLPLIRNALDALLVVFGDMGRISHDFVP